MRLVVDTLTRILDLGTRKFLSSSRNANLPNIFARRDPRAAARSAKIRASKSAARNRSTAARGGNARTARRQANGPLQRCNTALVPRPATYPHPPGAYIPEPSFVIPGFPDIDHRHIPLPVRDKIFLDALFAERRTVLRAADEQDAQARAEEEAEYARLVEQDLKKAQEAHRRAEEAEYARLLLEDRRRAEELHRRAVEEERRRAEQEREREESRRRERRERRERRRRERERRECHVAESAQPDPAERLKAYEAQWATLRGTVVLDVPLRFSDIPWPVFERVHAVEDVTEERVVAFVFHPLHALIQGHGEGQSKAARSEMLRWHSDKFDGRVLHKVAESDREAVRATAGHVVRLLTRFI